jgi:hypothetical protein
VETKLQTFLTLSLAGFELLTSRSIQFIPEEKAVVKHWAGVILFCVDGWKQFLLRKCTEFNNT